MTKIIECPFCGNDPDPQPCCIGLKTNPRYQIYCPCCEYWGPVGHSPQLAVEAWNTRRGPLQDELDRLRKELDKLNNPWR